MERCYGIEDCSCVPGYDVWINLRNSLGRERNHQPTLSLTNQPLSTCLWDMGKNALQLKHQEHQRKARSPLIPRNWNKKKGNGVRVTWQFIFNAKSLWVNKAFASRTLFLSSLSKASSKIDRRWYFEILEQSNLCSSWLRSSLMLLVCLRSKVLLDWGDLRKWFLLEWSHQNSIPFSSSMSPSFFFFWKSIPLEAIVFLLRVNHDNH